MLTFRASCLKFLHRLGDIIVKKTSIVTLSILVLVWAISQFGSVTIDDSFWETAKCPACYGDVSCTHLKAKLVLDQWSIWNLINVKNVYYGHLMGTIRVVVKKLAHTQELNEFDRIICHQLPSREATQYTPTCNVGETWHHFTAQQYHELKNDPVKTLQNVINIVKIKTEASGFETGVVSCLSERFLELVLDQFHSSLTSDVKVQISNAAATLLINPEPIVQKILVDHLPKLFGVCGRVIVEEYVGPTLAQFHWSSWRTRLELAVSLLELIKHLKTSTGFVFYLTDVSFDNFAVSNENGNMKVKLIDGESLVVVDTNTVGANIYHTNDFEHKNNELSFSAGDLCLASHADHNYYAICKCLLSEDPCSPGFSGGLLWGLPNEIEERWHIRSLVRVCVNGHESRFETSDKLLNSMRKILDQ